MNNSGNGAVPRPAENPEITNVDLALLARWLLAEGGTLEEFVDIIEKPHRWLPELNAARLLDEVTRELTARG